MAKRLDVNQVVEALRAGPATVADLAQKFSVNKATVTRALTQIQTSAPEISVVGKRETGKRGRPQKIFGVKSTPAAEAQPTVQ